MRMSVPATRDPGAVNVNHSLRTKAQPSGGGDAATHVCAQSAYATRDEIVLDLPSRGHAYLQAWLKASGFAFTRNVFRGKDSEGEIGPDRPRWV